jgi:hypothetical protein
VTQAQRRVWERAGAAAGICAAGALGLGYVVGGDWITLARLLGGTLVLWFAATLADRLRGVEGDRSRLAEVVFGIGVLWSGVWLLSAFFNSVSVLLGQTDTDPAGSRLASLLAAQLPAVLTASLAFTLLLAVSLVVIRTGGLPRRYGYASGGLAVVILVLSVIDWYGPGTLNPWIVTLALLWMVSTGVLLLQ